MKHRMTNDIVYIDQWSIRSMLKLQSRLCILLSLYLLSLSFHAYATQPPVSLPKVQTSIHIIYSGTLTSNALPEVVTDDNIEQKQHRIDEIKQSNDASALPSAEGDKIYWEGRRNTKTEALECEYWGTDDKMLWCKNRMAFAYNGSAAFLGEIGDVAPKLVPGIKSQGTVIVGMDPHLLTLDIPYLGFAQPGLPLSTAQTGTRTENSTVIEESYHSATEKKDFRVVFKNGRLSNIQVLLEGHVLEEYVYAKHKDTQQGFALPYQVTYTRYMYLNDKTGKHPIQNIDQRAVYRVTSVDEGKFDSSILDLQQPNARSTIQDFRQKYNPSGNGAGLMYTYVDANIPLDQYSQQEYDKQTAKIRNDKFTQSKSMLLRFSSLVGVFFIILMLMYRIRTRKQAY